MTDTGKPRTRATGKRAAAVENPTTWFCKNCGETNVLEATECLRCGFSSGFDPEVAPSVDFQALSATLEEQAELKRRQLRFIMDLVKNALLLILVIVCLVVGLRLVNNWPFHGAFDQDASELLDEVLAVQSHLDLGVTKGQYDELLVPLMVKNTKFKLKYGETPERQKEIYQQLNKAAEFYQLAREAWENQLTSADTPDGVNPNARSTTAADEVKRRWDEAKRSAILAAKNLR